MTAAATRPFVPGTTGWTVRDLDDPAIEHHWFAGRYEIVEGVLTTLPPAYFDHGAVAMRLVFLLREHFDRNGIKGSFAPEVDVVLEDPRVAMADFVFMTPEDLRKQSEAALSAGKADVQRTRVLIPPTLIIESVSPGHELHDQRTKRRWYAEFGVQNYWVLDAYEKSLCCLILRERIYVVDAEGRNNDSIRPSFAGAVTIPLSQLWNE